MDNLQSHSTSNPNTFSQYGAAEALAKGEEGVRKMCPVSWRRRDLMCDQIKSIPNVSAVTPDGAFYFFVNIAKTGLSSMQMTEQLLDKAKVAVIPGDVFGSEEHIRLSFATSEELITKGLTRIRDFVQSLHG